VEKASSPLVALKILERAKGPQQTGQEIDAAVAQLKKLGYTQGS
jgi:hypothetical protein